MYAKGLIYEYRFSKFASEQVVIFCFMGQNTCKGRFHHIPDMKSKLCISILLFCLCLSAKTQAADTLVFKGQASAWLNLNPTLGMPLWAGARYIPALNYTINLHQNRLLDFEASANLGGNAGIHPFDSVNSDLSLKPYRFRARYSSSQFEIRIGLQKINFGSAVMLRPLMWFDQMDARDPLQLTNGVWAALGRYYFLKNANIWLWSLYGNTEAKTWEVAKTTHKTPEFGGRIQIPVLKGDAAFSCHFRQADTRMLIDSMPGHANTPEQRIGLDGKWDIGPGIWFEGAWIHKSFNTGKLTNQEILTAGTDYTFGLGNGLNVVFEHMEYGFGKAAFDFDERLSFSGISLTYPLNISNQLNAVFYYDHTHNASYNLVNWKHQLNKLDLYFMAYWNPEDYKMPLQNTIYNLTAGNGMQMMLVFNH